MWRLTIEQHVHVIEAYFENGCLKKKAFRALIDHFGQPNRLMQRTIWKLAWKLKPTVIVADVKKPLQAGIHPSDERVGAVCNSTTAHSDAYILHGSQESHLSRTTLHWILTEYLFLEAYRIQLTKRQKLVDYLKSCTLVDWMQRKRNADHDFYQKSSLVRKLISILVNSLIKKMSYLGSQKSWDDFWKVTTFTEGHHLKCMFCLRSPWAVLFKNDGGNLFTVTDERYWSMITNVLESKLDAMAVECLWFQ